MTVAGAIVFILLLVVLVNWMGIWGLVIAAGVLFGLVLSTHQRVKEIHQDIKRIKAHLDIPDSPEGAKEKAEEAAFASQPLEVRNEAIERELEMEGEVEPAMDREQPDRSRPNEQDKP